MTKRFLAAAAAALMIALAPASAAAAASGTALPVLAKSEYRIGSGVKTAAGPAAGTKNGAGSLKKDYVSKTGLPGNFRLSCGEWTKSHIKKVGKKKAAQVSRQGLDTLRVSGSAQPSPAGLALVRDEILRFYHSLPENAWVHFHCRAGKGRTTSLCLMFDILRNPDLDYETLALRQYLLRGKNMLDEVSVHSLDGILMKQSKMLPLFYQYVNTERFSDTPLSWSEWLSRSGY